MSSFDCDATPSAAWNEPRDVYWRIPSGAPHRAGEQGLTITARTRVTRFIEEHLADRITLSELASAACMSRFHFARMFRLSFGQSPMEYVLAAKVELAKQLLLAGNHSIAYVAAMLGFADQSHFTRSFRRVAGCSPRQFIAERNGHVHSASA
jgi:AraC-like DNA-binding protein